MKALVISVVTFFSLSVVAQQKEAKKENVIDNKGDKLFSVIYPTSDRETIILLHGGPGFPSDIEEVADALKERFQVITFHQRGTGKSPCKSKNYSMDAYLSDIEKVREFYKIEKFHLWGHSWGGLYAQIYAEKHAGNLLSLFLCCPGSGTNYEWKQTEKEVMQLNKSKCTFWQWSKMGMNNFLGILGSDKAYKRLFTQVMKNYNNDFIETDHLKIDFDNLKAAPINKTRPEIVKYPVLQQQNDPKFKITIVYGGQDIYKASKNFVIQRYPTAEVTTIQNCGHIPWLHNPTEYAKILTRHYE